MIDKVVDTLQKEIQAYLESMPELKISNAKKIYATSVVKFDGTPAINDDSLGLTLVNIEEERAKIY